MEADSARILNSVGALFILGSLWLWWRTWRAHGQLTWSTVALMTRTTARSSRLHFLVATLAFIVATAASMTGLLDLPPVPPFLALGIAASSLTTVCRPASVLVLGASIPTNTDLYVRLVRTAQPLRAVHLLSLDSFQNPRQSLDRNAWNDQDLTQSQLRVVRGPAWYVVVAEIMNIAPVIILDIRTMTPAIFYETRRILSSDRLRRKTVFIAELTRPDPIFTAHYPAHYPIRIVTPDAAIAWLRSRQREAGRSDHPYPATGEGGNIPAMQAAGDVAGLVSELDSPLQPEAAVTALVSLGPAAVAELGRTGADIHQLSLAAARRANLRFVEHLSRVYRRRVEVLDRIQDRRVVPPILQALEDAETISGVVSDVHRELRRDYAIRRSHAAYKITRQEDAEVRDLDNAAYGAIAAAHSLGHAAATALVHHGEAAVSVIADAAPRLGGAVRATLELVLERIGTDAADRALRAIRRDSSSDVE